MIVHWYGDTMEKIIMDVEAIIENQDQVQLPQNILNIPVCTNNLVLERSKSPIDFYNELETIGSWAYGIVKKVCLKSNPDTIRAMKIIPKKNLFIPFSALWNALALGLLFFLKFLASSLFFIKPILFLSLNQMKFLDYLKMEESEM